MNRQPVRAGQLGDRHVGFERSMDHLAVSKCVFEDVIRFPETLLQIAATYMRTESDVSAGLSLQVLQVRESRGRS